jgi:hypothetical protein
MFAAGYECGEMKAVGCKMVELKAVGSRARLEQSLI